MTDMDGQMMARGGGVVEESKMMHACIYDISRLMRCAREVWCDPLLLFYLHLRALRY